MTGSPWWRDAVVYQVYPRSFQDSDGDGLGDLPGATTRLSHIRDLGAHAVWLSPFYPSPDADHGYDISDFTAVDPRLGTLDDLDELIAEAHRLGLRVLADLVPNHTSIEHPWFRVYPDRYVWSEHGPGNNWLASFGGPRVDSRRAHRPLVPALVLPRTARSRLAQPGGPRGDG